MMQKKIIISISLCSICIGLLHWGQFNASLNLRGGVDVVAKNDEASVERAESSRSHEEAHAARLRAYNLSPFERHWPAYHLDPWMRKQVDTYPSKENEVCLVHVGKSAGYTVACALGFHSPGCNETKSIGLLPYYTTKWSHAGLYDCFDDSAYYLFVVRNPLDRSVSAFNYGKPYTWERAKRRHGLKYYQRLKALYLDCFDTIEQLAAWGLSKNGNATVECRKRASDAIDGTVRFENHLYFNFQYHLEMIPKKSRIIVMRTEHLVQDWNSAEFAVGGKQGLLGHDQTLIPHINDGNPNEQKYLSDESRILVCERLCNEIQVYKRILNESINLSKDQVDESIAELYASCPVETVSTSCNSPLPVITDKLMANRGYDKGVILDTNRPSEISVGRSVHKVPTI